MRNLKKILSVLLVVAMIAVTMVPAFAAENYTYDAQAKALYDVGLFKGISATEYAPDLGSSVTREQGIAIVVRLLGKADAAAALKAADADTALTAYTDAKDIDASLKNAVAYAVKNGLVLGATTTTIDPKGEMTGNQLATILLRNLGYTVDDKAFDTAAATLADKGGLTADQVTKFATKDLIRDDLVGIAYGSLTAKYSTSGTKVIDQLIADKVVDQAKAEAAGIVAKATAATSMTAKATARDTITVTFDGAVTDTSKAAITLKKGTTTFDVKATFADDKKSATLKYSTKFPSGDYTVTASGVAAKDLTATVTFEDEKIAKIEFTSDKAVIVPTASGSADENKSVYAYFKITNQYGDDITSSYNTYSSDFTWTSSYTEPDTSDAEYGKVKISIAAGSNDTFTYGESVPVSAVYNNDTVVTTASTVLTVANKAGIGELSVTKLYNDLDKKINVNSTFESFYLLFDLKDQYGNALTFDGDESTIKDDLTVSSSNGTVLTFNKNSDGDFDFQNLVVDGKDVIALPLNKPDSPRSGSAVVTVVSKTTGKMAQYTVEVADGTYAAAFTMQSPDAAVTGEKIIIPFSAYDSEGNEVTDVDDLNCSDKDYRVTFTVSGINNGESKVHFEENSATGKAQLVLDTLGMTYGDGSGYDIQKDSTVSITSLTGKTYKTSTLNIRMKEPKKPDAMGSIPSSYVKKIMVGGFADFNISNVNVKDQYGRTYSPSELRYFTTVNPAYNPDGKKYRINVRSSSDNIQVISSGLTSTTTDANDKIGSFYENQTDKLYFYASQEGSSTITVALQTYDSAKGWNDVSGIDTSFVVSGIAQKDVTDYTIDQFTSTVFDTNAYDWSTQDLQTPYYADGNLPAARIGDKTTNFYKGNTYADGTADYDTRWDNTVTVYGKTSDGSKVNLSQQYMLNYNPTTVSAGVYTSYSIKPAYGSKMNLVPDTLLKIYPIVNGVISSSYIPVVYKQKISIKPGDYVTETTDDDNAIDVPVTIAVTSLKNTDLLDKASDGTALKYSVDDNQPIVTKLSLVSNTNVLLSSDGASIEVYGVDVNTNAKFGTGTEASKIYNIVCQAVKAVDQYGKEFDVESGSPTSDFYDVSYTYQNDATSFGSVGDRITVTVFSKSGAKSIKFDICVK